uniref:L-seryl-tRNA(Sec) selenium transferase n=1 Tax=candidate division WOR-3 bacterium TaxID=2052148 RepID=A0A7C3YQL9_UNCW3
MANKKNELLRQIPSVNTLLQKEEIRKLLLQYPRELVLFYLREELKNLREGIDEGRIKEIVVENILENIREKVWPSLRRAIQGLGIILHTGLGRAPLPKIAQEALLAVTENFCNLEIDEKGRRGSRYRHIEKLLQLLTGAESGMIVNNNAGATLLVLNTFAAGKEVIVSRGELIEIGGAFRLPDVMARSGAKLVEVGTTNRTHLRDYREAINPNTALILKVHKSNYEIIGFTKEVELKELITLGREFNLLIVHDLGSGALIDLSQYGLPKEPVVRESIKEGADLCLFSGDKLLGGPQSGVIVGRKDLLDKIRKNPLTRALRCDKLTFAAMEATLRLFLDEEKLKKEHPVLNLLTKDLKTIEKEAKEVKKALAELKDLEVEIIDTFSLVGGGSLATAKLPSKALAIRSKKYSAERLAEILRRQPIPIFGRVENERYLLDFRTIRQDEVKIVKDSLIRLLS